MIKIEQGECYHIYNRGNNRDLIFFEEENYHYFLSRFEIYVLPYCEVYSYCLMPNHFHFFLKVIKKLEFERGLKNFFISYVKSINKKYDRVGSLWQGRYKAKLVTSGNYFRRIVTYIHQNPTSALLVKDLKDYPFSSYQYYVNGKPSFLVTEPVLEWFNGIEGFIADHQTYDVFKTS